MTRMTTAMVGALAGVAILALGGCSGDPEPAADSSAEPAPAPVEESPVEDVTADAAPAESDGEAGTDDDAGEDDGSDGSGPECLEGDWVVGNAQLGGWYRGFVGGEGIDIGDVSGEILLSMASGEYIYATDGVTIEMFIGGQDATTLLTGGVAGTYLAEPSGVMSTQIEDSDFDARVTVSGIDFSAQEMGIDLRGAGAFVGYECDGDSLTLETQSAGPETAFLQFEAAN